MRSVSICCVLTLAAILQAQTPADTQPAVLVRNDPEYSAEATRARVQSTVLLSVVIGEDGKARDVQVAKGAGFGLDEKAIEAIAGWVFRPATIDGHAAPVPANIEMNFHLQVKGEPDDHSGQFARLNFTLPPGVSRPELIVGKLPGNPLSSGDQALRIRLTVDVDGKPANLNVLGATDKAWEQQAVRAIQAWRFRPASLDGAAIPADAIFELAHSEPEETEPVLVEPPQESVRIPKPPPAPIQIPGLISRANHTATLLNNGTVLIAGGAGLSTSAQIFDPITRAIVNTGSMLTARQSHTATLLNDGTVLIAGGQANGRDLAEAEIFDPSTGKFSATGSMRKARSSHAAALLPDGRVLVCGGNSPNAEIYDPRKKSFLPAGQMKNTQPLIRAVRLKGGRILIVGPAAAEIFHPESVSFSSVESTLKRAASVVTLLANGQVLLAGDAEIFDPATDTFRPTGAMSVPRAGSASVLLSDGKVLVTGGGNSGSASGNLESDGTLSTTEIYDPASETFSPGPRLTGLHIGHTATLLEDGSVLIAGSAERDNGSSAELLFTGSRGR